MRTRWTVALVTAVICLATPKMIQARTFAFPVQIVDAPNQISDPASVAREEHDLLAQQQMAIWAQWMFWASAASVVVSTAALIGLFTSLRQTRQAVRDAREVGEVQTQAYVHAASASFGMGGTVIVSCHNTGSTPATHFSVAGTIRLVERGKVSDSIGFTNGPFKKFAALGAGETLTVAIGPSQELQRFKSAQADDQLLLVCGQITYCTIFKHNHETQFAFYVDPVDRSRFRRPVSNIRSYWRIPKDGLPAPTLVDPTAQEPMSAEEEA